MSAPAANPGIVVGVDGSPPSTKAVRWAAHEALMRNVPLTLVYVMSSVAMGSPAVLWPAAPIPDELIQWQEDQARQILADAVKTADERMRGGDAPEIVSGVIRSAPVPSLVDLSKAAQLMVVGSRGHGRLRRMLLGSVSSGLVHHAHCPVAVIREEMPEGSDFEQLPVLVGIDGSRASEGATAIAFEEASFRGVDLIALHAWSDADVSDLPTLELSAVQTSAEKLLSERLAGFQERYPDVNVRRTIVGDKPAHYLLEAAESAQLIVVGSRGRGGFTGMLLGSVSSAVVNGADIPVIVAR